ncbi:MAG TPA: hypothetical protein VFS38_04210 [Actinomycetota bacterium]|nr:hypothetical protein [Actinomycetota bacterium]
MSTARVVRLVFATTVLFFLAGLVLFVAAEALSWSTATFFVVELAFPATGLIILLRTSNRVGWILLGAGLGLGIQAFCAAYAEYGLSHSPGVLPGASIFAWVSDIIWLPQLLMATMFLFLLFPDGRLPSARWRLVIYVGIAGALLTEIGIVFESDVYGYSGVQAPFAGLISQSFLELLSTIGGLMLLPAILLALASLFVRYRSSGTVARLQIKWFLFAAVAFLASQLAFNIFGLAEESTLLLVVEGLSALLIPGAVSVAILKYRLYDIDFIINRTLLWTFLTATLSAVYFVAVAVLQGAINPLAEDSSLSVAISTLVAAALFRPARSRIQAFIDRAFYRSRYDAGQTVEAFAAKLRDELDLDALTAELVSVTTRVMQPSKTLLWLREPPSRAPTQRPGIQPSAPGL